MWTGPGATPCHSDCTATRPSVSWPMQRSSAQELSCHGAVRPAYACAGNSYDCNNLLQKLHEDGLKGSQSISLTTKYSQPPLGSKHADSSKIIAAQRAPMHSVSSYSNLSHSPPCAQSDSFPSSNEIISQLVLVHSDSSNLMISHADESKLLLILSCSR